MQSTTISCFGLCRERIEAMTGDGESLASIEAMLDEAPLSSDERDAAWLFAWALAQQAAERAWPTPAALPAGAGRQLRPVPGEDR